METKLSKLNDKIDLYYKTHYKVQEYNIKPPNLRTTKITIVPYGHRKWMRKRLARQKCLKRGQPNNTHLTLVANTTTQPKYTKLTFDSDSYEIMVDNCCSQSITNNIKDYVDPPTNTSVQIKGYNGTSTTTTKIGTVLWKWSDDKGKVHNIVLPNTYYSPTTETRLLSPQHWAKEMKQGRGTKCTTYHDAIILQWSHGKYTKTIPITKQTRNVGIITSAPGIHNYNKVYQKTLSLFPALAFPTTIDFNIVTDDEASTTSVEQTHSKDQPTKTTKNSERPNLHG
jgi:hypothetical protein